MNHRIHFLRHNNPLQSLALALVLLLLLPSAPFSSPKQSPFAAQAQITVGGCTGNERPDLWLIDVNSSGIIFCGGTPELRTFEDSIINDFIASRGLNVDKNYLLTYGSPELRNDLRAQLTTALLAVVTKAPNLRTTQEQAAFNWLRGIAVELEAETYKKAVELYNSYKANPCAFKLDTDIATTYNVSLNTANCSNFGRFNVFNYNDHQPSADYYLAVATKSTWGQVTAAPGADAKYTELNRNIGIALGVGVAAGTIAALSTANYVSLIAPYAVRAFYVAFQGVAAINTAATTATIAAGPFFIVTIAIQVLVSAAFDFANVKAVEEGLVNLVSKNNDLQAALLAGNFDLTTLLNSENSYKFALAVLKGTATELATPYPTLPTRDGLDPYFSTSRGLSRLFSHKDTKGRWIRTSLYNGFFKREACVGTATNQCSNGQVSDNTPALLSTFTLQNDSDGNQYTISRAGDRFYVKWINAPSTAVSCPAEGRNRVSPGAYTAACDTFFTDRIPGWIPADNINIDFTISAGPKFNLSDFQIFNAGTAKTFRLQNDQNLPIIRGTCTGDTATTLANPLPLGNGISITGEGTSNFAVVYNPAQGSPATGNYDLTLCSQYSEGGVRSKGTTKNYVFALATGTPSKLQFITKESDIELIPNFVDIPFAVTVRAVGNPIPRYSLISDTTQDPLQAVQVIDNNDGTATISGRIPNDRRYRDLGRCQRTNSPDDRGTCLVLIADNGFSKDFLNFSLAPAQTQDASSFQPSSLGGGINARWISGQSNSLIVSTSNSSRTFTIPAITLQANGLTGGEEPRSIVPDTGVKYPLAAAPWLSFQDKGDGTAVISGTPPLNSAATIVGNLIARNSFARFAQSINLDIRVEPTPLILTPLSLNITQGQTAPIQFLNDAILTVRDAQTGRSVDLPAGIALEGSGRNWLFRTSNSINPGSYNISMQVAGPQAGAFPTQFSLNVLKLPEIVALTPNNAISIRIHAGTPVTTNLDLVGLPKSALPAVGSTVIQLQGAPALSNFVTYRGLNSFGTPTGTGKLSFNFPATAPRSFFVLQFLAVPCSNQTPCLDRVSSTGFPTFRFNVQVVQPGDANNDATVDCADVSLVRAALGRNVSQPGYNIHADVNLDGLVDIRDLSFVSSKQRPGTICR